MKQDVNTIIQSTEDFLTFLKTKSQLFHLSNVFFRDFHYGIMAYAETKGKKISYGKAEVLAWDVIRMLEVSGILKSIKPGSWMLNYAAFKKPSVKTEIASKPSSVSAAAKSAAAAPSSGLSSPPATEQSSPA